MDATVAIFVAIAAALAVAAAAAVAWPLRRGSPRLFAALVAGVPVLALCLYMMVGAPAGLRVAPPQAPQSLEDAVAQLEADLANDPAQPEGWRLLARARAEAGNATGARDAYAKAAELLPDDAALQVEYAESRARANAGNRFDAEAIAILERVLAKDANDQRARWFLGIAKRQAGDAAGAAATWEPLLALVDDATARALRPQVDAARAEAGLAPLAGAEPASAAGAHAVSVRVTVDPALLADAPSGAAVFVVARVPGGPPMPVAVQRHALRALPAEIVLGDGDGPMPTQRLSALREVELVARLSADGSANRGPGDVESAPVRIPLPATAPVALAITPKR